jgi:hypothetical protein
LPLAASVCFTSGVIKPLAFAKGEERERVTDVSYVIQSGAFKSLGIRWRYGSNRFNYAHSTDENRVMLSYAYFFD